RQDRIELGKSGFFALSSLLNGVSISTFLLHTQLIERKSTGNVPVA
ncbi:MAG: LacI family transcriptional regulator, partial [Blautia wexlerae]